MPDTRLQPIYREYAVSLGIWGWLLLLCRAVGITLVLAFKALRAALGGSSKSDLTLSWYKYVAYEGVRDFQCGLSAVGIQNLRQSTSQICRGYAETRGIPYSLLHLPYGTTAVRLGPPKPLKVVVLFHGGGYMAPALPDHIPFAFGFPSSTCTPSDTAVYVLQYALASENANHYPRQLQQAVALLEQMTQVEKIPASLITLVGDSAGGHLALSLLLHLAHPCPGVDSLAIDGRLSGAALVSPWVIHAEPSGPPGESIGNDEAKDVIHGVALNYWARNLLGGQVPTAWSHLLTAPDQWWRDVPVERIFIAFGQHEVLRDSIATLSKKVSAAHGRVMAREYAGELHVHMIMNRFLHINEFCQSEEDFKSWLADMIR